MSLPKLIATDLDGTFFRQDLSYDEAKFERVLDALDEIGGRFVIATGNERTLVDRRFEKFVGRLDYVINNGAEVISRDNDQLRLATLSEQQIRRAQETIELMNESPKHGAVFNGVTKAYMLRQYKGHGPSFEKVLWYFPDLIFIDDISEIDEPILKTIIEWPEAEADAFIATMQARLGEEAHVTTSGYGAVDIVAPGTNKAVGLKVLADQYDIGFEEMAAFGDGLNDLEMLKAVGRPVAMPNGDASLKAQFELAVADNQHDGVLDTILSW